MNTKQIGLIFVIIILIVTVPATGQIYKWVDENGVKHISDRPPPEGATIIKKAEGIPHDEAADGKRMEKDRQDLQKMIETSRANDKNVEEKVTPETLTGQLKWPRLIENEKGTLKVYQPQIEQFDQDAINLRMAIEIAFKDKKSPIYGALWVMVTAETDFEERLVQMKNFKVSRIEISLADPNRIKRLENFINTLLTNKTLVISLDRFLASAASDPNPSL